MSGKLPGGSLDYARALGISEYLARKHDFHLPDAAIDFIASRIASRPAPPEGGSPAVVKLPDLWDCDCDECYTSRGKHSTYCTMEESMEWREHFKQALDAAGVKWEVGE